MADFDNPEQRSRAEKTRALAQDMNDPGAKAMMLLVADNYERLAVHAEAVEGPEARRMMTQQAHTPNLTSGKRRWPSPVSKRSIKIAGRTTSISLEPAFMSALKEIAVARRLTINELVSKIDNARQFGNLSSAIRLFVLAYYQGPR